MTIAERIRGIRAAKGLDQDQFADLVETSQSTVARWENGARPRPEALAKIAEVGGISLDALIQGHTDDGAMRWLPRVGSLSNADRFYELPPIGRMPIEASRAGERAFIIDIANEMGQVLPEGGFAIIDPDDLSLYGGQCYAVRFSDKLVAARFSNDPASFDDIANGSTHSAFLGTDDIKVLGKIVMYGNFPNGE